MPATLIFFETSSRLAQEPGRHGAIFGTREAAVAKELTKLHEGVTRGTARPSSPAAFADGEALKGEFVVVVGAARRRRGRVERRDDRRAARQEALKLESFRDAVRAVAEDAECQARRVYELGLKLERKD